LFIVVGSVRVSDGNSFVDIRRVLFVDVGGEVSIALVDHLLDVGADVLVVTGDVGALCVVSESVDVFSAVVVLAGKVSAPLVAVVHSSLEGVLVTVLLVGRAWSVHTLSGNSGNQKRSSFKHLVKLFKLTKPKIVKIDIKRE
jgi:hypothetical protein